LFYVAGVIGYSAAVEELAPSGRLAAARWQKQEWTAPASRQESGASLLLAGFCVKRILAYPEYLTQPMHRLGQHARVSFAIGMFDRMSVLVGILNMNQSQIHRAILHRRQMQSTPRGLTQP